MDGWFGFAASTDHKLSITSVIKLGRDAIPFRVVPGRVAAWLQLGALGRVLWFRHLYDVFQ